MAALRCCLEKDGARVVTASADKAARVWLAASGMELARMGHGDRVSGAAGGPDGKRILTASQAMGEQPGVSKAWADAFDEAERSLRPQVGVGMKRLPKAGRA